MGYGINNIQVLEGLEAVRKRPGMYIGSTDSRGLHHLIWEIVDNSIDEHLAGVCDTITVRINEDNSISVEDNGRGIPVEPHPTKKVPGVRLIFTTLHAGGKFDSEGYKFSGGLHGVGSSVVNALSKWMEVTVTYKGKEYIDRYENGGYPVTKLTSTGTLRGKSISDKEKHGTIVTFYPDDSILETTKWKPEIIKQRLSELSYLNKGLKIIFENKKTNETEIFHKENGIVGYIEEFNTGDNFKSDVFYFEEETSDMKLEVAFAYTTEQTENIISFCNNINTHEGGTHVAGFRSGITKLVNYYVKELNSLKGNLLDAKDIRQGIISIVSIYHPDPQFEGQTKTKLGSSDARNAVESIIYNKGQLFFDKNITLMNDIIENAIKAMNMRKKIDSTRQNYNSKELLLRANGKLAVANSKNPEECEIFLVEGDSAGGSAKEARNKKFQAVLPLKGKIINVSKQTIDKVYKNEEIQTMITAFGCGIGDDFDETKLRYKKVIIMTDADVDGAHIDCLALTFIYTYLPQLIYLGHVYISVTPLYQIFIKDSKKEFHEYVYNDRELDIVKKKYGNKIKRISRFKGLGEMNPDKLEEVALNPKSRKLKRIVIDNPLAAAKCTDILMGSEVEPRRKWIMNYAKEKGEDLS